MILKVSEVLFIVIVTIASQYAYEYCKKKKQKTNTEIHEVMMFSQDTTVMKKSKHSRSMITPSMDRLLYYMSSPRHSIDICMYVITNKILANAILKLHLRNVKVRLIVDADMAFSSGAPACVRRLEMQGVPVRWMKSTNIMHHKFCLIDTSEENVKYTPVVIAGSLNWTNNALCGNWEDVIVTSQKDIVRQYQAEFERLWVQFKRIA